MSIDTKAVLADHLARALDRADRLERENRDLRAQLDGCTCTAWDDPARDVLIASDTQDAIEANGGVFIR